MAEGEQPGAVSHVAVCLLDPEDAGPIPHHARFVFHVALPSRWRRSAPKKETRHRAGRS
jgi:hypothetical protein